LGKLVSISPTFYVQLLHENPFAKKLQTQIVSAQKLCKKLLSEKAARKKLGKLKLGGFSSLLWTTQKRFGRDKRSSLSCV
jgi:hypothetical protein